MSYPQDIASAAAEIKADFCRRKEEQTGTKSNPREGDSFYKAAKICIDEDIMPQVLVAAVFYYTHYQNSDEEKKSQNLKPYARQLHSDYVLGWVNNYIKETQLNIKNGKIDLIFQIKTNINALQRNISLCKEKLNISEEELLLDELRFFCPAYIKVIVGHKYTSVVEKYLDKALKEINENFYIKQTLELHKCMHFFEKNE